MRLSEAIRLGSMLRPQAFNDLVNDVGTCALGAAYQAVGLLGSLVQFTEEDRYDIFPVMEPCMECPVCLDKDLTPVGGLVTHLNDEHRWTRERIADWIESVEREIEARQQPADSLVDLVAK